MLSRCGIGYEFGQKALDGLTVCFNPTVENGVRISTKLGKQDNVIDFR